MREPRRRRRSDEDAGGGLPLFPLVLVVILAGLLLGGALAHFFGSPRVPRTGPTAAVALASAAATPTQAVAAGSIVARPSRSPAPTFAPSTAPTAKPTPAKTRTILPRSPKTPSPTKSPTVLAVVPSASPTSKRSAPPSVPSVSPSPPPSAQSRASTVVRSYLEALAHGDRAGAASYLAHGLPSETFMNPDARIESIRSANIGAQQYRVTADVQTASGEYYVTFTVENGPLGLQITDHYAIKPQ